MRAALALVVLALFFVFAVGITIFLVVVAVWRFRIGDYEGGAWMAVFAAAIALPVLWAVLRAFFARPAPTGVPMTRATHPELWRHVDEVAAVAGTRSPDDIRLVPDANASVWERRGTRYLELGLPLVAGMTVGELRSVLAHELGHYGGGHTQVGAMTFRAKIALQLAVQQGDFLYLLHAWARLYWLFAASESRDHERFADEVAVAAAGQDAARRALLRIGPLGEGWGDYLQRYVSLAVTAGRTPPLLEGFRAYLDHPRRVHDLRELETVMAEHEPTSVFDSHPPVRERVAAMGALSPVAIALDERPAVSLLDGTPPEAVAALIDVQGPAITWEQLAPLTGPAQLRRYADALRHAGRVSRVGAALADVLACLERGELQRLTGKPVDTSLTAEQVHEAAIETVTELLAYAVADQLVTTGRAALELNWGGLFVLRLPDGAAVYPDDLVAPAVRDPARVPEVRVRLQAIGVDGL